jgi:hypothetical protein
MTFTRPNTVKFLEAAQNLFGHIIIAVPDEYNLLELRPDNPFLDFVNCEIKPFGHRLRGQLIYKWLSLGRETSDELEGLDNQVSVVEKIITTLLGKNVVPASPFNILSLLQMIESTQPHATSDGSYGSLHELLIKAQLSNADSLGRHSAEVKTTYLSMIAFSMFITEKTSLTESELRKLTVDYGNKFDYNPEFPAILSDLVNARALDQRNGMYSFKYHTTTTTLLRNTLTARSDGATPVKLASFETGLRTWWTAFTARSSPTSFFFTSTLPKIGK